MCVSLACMRWRAITRYQRTLPSPGDQSLQPCLPQSGDTSLAVALRILSRSCCSNHSRDDMAEVGKGDKEEADKEEADTGRARQEEADKEAPDTQEPEPLISPPQLIPPPPPQSLATTPFLHMTPPATCAPHDTILGRVGGSGRRLSRVWCRGVGVVV